MRHERRHRHNIYKDVVATQRGDARAELIHGDARRSGLDDVRGLLAAGKSVYLALHLPFRLPFFGPALTPAAKRGFVHSRGVCHAGATATLAPEIHGDTAGKKRAGLQAVPETPFRAEEPPQ